MKLCVLAGLATAAVLTAQITYHPPEKRNRQEAGTFRIEAGSHALPELVERAAQFLGRNVLWDESERATGPTQLAIRITEPMELDANGCEDVVSGLLYARNFALVPLNEERGLYEVVSMVGPRRGEVSVRALQRTPEEVLARPNLYIAVSTTVTLEFVDARTAAQALRPFFAQASPSGSGVLVGMTGASRSLLLQGFGPQVAEALRLLRIADQPSPEPPEPDPEVAELKQRIEELTKRVAELEKQVGVEKKD